jgi:hypothetical protein
MIEMVLDHADVARIRFAHSPMRELVFSIRTLQDPGGQRMYRIWLTSVRGRLSEPNMDLLTALLPAGARFVPDLLLPTPNEPWGALTDELEVVAATPPDVVRTELEILYEDRGLPDVLQPLYEDPAAHLPTVAEAIQRYWSAAIEPVWHRLRALSTADVSYRMDQFAFGGVERVLDDLHPELSLDQNRLQISKPRSCHHRFDLAGAGILLVPCVFAWRTLMVGCCGVDQPTLTYPPRGVAQFCEPAHEDGDPLAALIGKSRAALLTALGVPMTTTELAARFNLSAGTVSEHLAVLKSAALITSRRRGRMVIYHRTAAGNALVTTSGITPRTQR